VGDTPLRHRLEYAAMLAFAGLLRALPRPVAIEVGAGIGALGWILRLRRRLVLANLEQALPGATPRQRRQVAFRAARNFGRTTAEFVRFPGRDRRRLAELVSLEGLGELHAAVAEGRGAIVVTAHLGSWALYVTALAASGIPSALLVGRQHNAKVDAFILSIPGDAVRFISKGRGAPRDVLRCLHEGRAVVMVADQHSGPRGEVAPFLGRSASTLPLPGALAARHGTPICLMAGHRVTRGTHVVTLSRLQLPSGGDETTVRHAVTAACNEALGRAILAHPDQYFWYHRRWREGEAGTRDDEGPAD
jgi:Kdo2-lipid IVA lauroyltransferase/acyltransferase